MWWGMGVLVACTGSDDGPLVDTGLPAVELPEVYINEFMASNGSTWPDEGGAFPDWIELYNAGGSDADLGGYWLSDDDTDPFDHLLADGLVVPAGGYLVLWADGDIEEGELHTSFSLSADGEDIALFAPDDLDNELIDSVEAYALQSRDVSLARIPDGSRTWDYDPSSTPGASNDGP